MKKRLFEGFLGFSADFCFPQKSLDKQRPHIQFRLNIWRVLRNLSSGNLDCLILSDISQNHEHVFAIPHPTCVRGFLHRNAGNIDSDAWQRSRPGSYCEQVMMKM